MSSARSNTVWHRAAAALAAGWVVASAGCTPTTPARGQAAATVFPLYDLARRVAGDRLQVKLILEPGMDPHQYQPRPQDVVVSFRQACVTRQRR
jgi:zinc transport system substrate-binding protein